ncbi:MAG: hypothetical protein IJ542_00570 [Clostridia bacterium]|nr:hypothetical protein [Clostridia bacterium]
MFEKFLKRQQKIQKILGDDAIEICNILSQPKMSFYENAQKIAEYLMKHPKEHRELLIEYRNLTNLMVDPHMPTKPYYGRCAEDMYLIDKEVLHEEVKEWLSQWDEQRENKYWGANSVIYNYDYTDDLINCGKYPVAVGEKLGEFLQRTEGQLMKHTETGRPELSQLTFIEPMFAESFDNKLYRLAFVVELIPTTKKVGYTQREVPTFDFSVSVKLMPDDDLNHSSCIIRFDSKSKAHTNIFGKKSGIMSDHEQMERFKRERLYLQDSSKDSHLHIFDRYDQLIYCFRSLGSNSITLTQALNITRKTWRDKSAFNGLVKTMMGNRKVIDEMLELRKNLELADYRLERDSRRKAWLEQLDALRKAIVFVRDLLNISKERTLEEATSVMLGHGTTDVRRMTKEYNKLYPDNRITEDDFFVDEREES